MPRVVRFTQSGWSIAAGKGASAVAGHKGAADAYWNGALSAADVEDFAVTAEHYRDQLAIAGHAPSCGGAEQLPVVQGCRPESGAQCIPVDDHADVGWFTTGGGQLVGGAGALAQFDERIGVALGYGVGLGHAVAIGAPGCELLDQRADQAAVFGA